MIIIIITTTNITTNHHQRCGNGSLFSPRSCASYGVNHFLPCSHGLLMAPCAWWPVNCALLEFHLSSFPAVFPVSCLLSRLSWHPNWVSLPPSPLYCSSLVSPVSSLRLRSQDSGLFPLCNVLVLVVRRRRKSHARSIAVSLSSFRPTTEKPGHLQQAWFFAGA